ncbi:hypothetical protein [Halalkalicoccus subterraneus]|uniref:hypothetical protein n=1 Tax=Halalkalicoccus subterraneus TaxID=2675002 RepID=UPI000EFBEE84|nr:hypothetical protein [Halalkalicoccus subterraneus]
MLPLLDDPFNRLFDGYAEVTQTETEYAGTIFLPLDVVETVLTQDLGFQRNANAALEIRIDGDVSDGSWVWLESSLSDWQLHVIRHESDDGVEAYAHWEHSLITHPLQRYRMNEYQPETGVAMLRTWLREHRSDRFPDGLPFEVKPFYRRPAWYRTFVRNASKTLANWTHRIDSRGESVPRVDAVGVQHV